MQRMNRLMALLFLGVVLASLSVMGANQNASQENVTINLSILDQPIVSIVTVDDSDTSSPDVIDPTPNTTYVVNCSATVTDADGEADIDEAWGYLWHDSATQGVTTEYHSFYNSSCTDIDTGAVVDNEATVDCLFTLPFYAWNGSWTCNITVNDTVNLSGTDTRAATVTELMAINVNNSDLDFGQLAVNDSTGTDDFYKRLFNEGNVNISVKLNTWGDDPGDGGSMNCTTGSIRADQLRVASTASQDWDTQKIAIPSTANDGTDVFAGAFAIERQNTGLTPTSALLYFGMGTNAEGDAGLFSGDCSGNLMFTGILDS